MPLRGSEPAAAVADRESGMLLAGAANV